ncbi:MAG: uracil-DNA glycosylase [Myxococcales bacterium]|jgi:uracil-DNA glycosylase family 4
MAESEREELAAVAADLRGHLEWLRESGTSSLPKPAPVEPAAPCNSTAAGAAGGPILSLRAAVRASVGAGSPQAAPSAAAPSRPVVRPPERGAPIAPPPAASAPRQAPAPQARSVAATGRRMLEQIRAELGDCRRCRLAAGRMHLVFGVGNPRAQIVFVGEGPGAEEDRQGIPFVGTAGELLTKMIEAMGFTRDEVYICNVVKCRPPGNRNPEPDEIAACEPFLMAQLASIQPKVIVTLGKFAAQTLLRDSTPITRLRGNWREYCGIKLMPTFHPAYLLRSPGEKRKAWEDLKLVMKEFGREPGSAQKR